MASKYAIETIFKLIDNITAPLDKVGVKSSKVGSRIKNDFVNAQKSVDEFGKTAQKRMGQFALAGAGAVVAFAGKGVKDALEYQTALAKLGTIADTTQVPMSELDKQLMTLSKQTGVSVSELTASTYEAISSGIDTASSVQFTGVAFKAAKAGFTDTATALDGLTTVLNAYGLKADSAGKITDQMLIAQNLGKTTFGEMAASLGQVIPISSALNVKTEELFSSIATLTSFGIGTAESMTGMKAALSNIIKPTAQASKLAQDLGLDFSATALQSKGLKGFLDGVAKATGGDQEKMATLFGSVEALNAVTVLTGKGADLFAKSLDQMATSAGATDAAFEKMNSTPAERMSRSMNKIKLAGINAGTALLPVFERVADKIGNFGDKLMTVNFKSLADGASFALDVIVWLINTIWALRVPIIAIATVVGIYNAALITAAIVEKGFAVASGIAKAAMFIETLVCLGQTAALKTLTAGTLAHKVATLAFAAANGIASGATGFFTVAMGALNAVFVASPIGWIVLGIVAAIAALVVIIVLCVKHWDAITAAIGRFCQWAEKVAQEIWTGICKAFTDLRGLVSENANKVLAFITIFTGPFGMIISVVKELHDNWSAIVEAFKTEGIIGGLMKLGGVILSGILAPVQGLLETLSKIPGIGNVFSGALDSISSLRNGLKGIDDKSVVARVDLPKNATLPIDARNRFAQPIQQYALPKAAGMSDAERFAIYGTPRLLTTSTGAADSAISREQAQPLTAPITTGERAAYSRSDSYQHVGITVGTERGATARVSDGSKPAGLNITRSGGF
jgi:TP901 family phage tail tape measure protein